MTVGGAIRLVGLEKRFGEQVAVDRIDLAIEPGEFWRAAKAALADKPAEPWKIRRWKIKR